MKKKNRKLRTEKLDHNHTDVRLFLTGLNSKNAKIEVLINDHVVATLAPKRVFPRITKLLRNNFQFLYFNAKPSLRGRFQSLIQEQTLLARRNPRLFFSEFFKCYSIEIPRNLAGENLIQLRLENSKRPCWVSRGAINFNVISPFLSHEIERSRARSSQRFDFFVWSTYGVPSLNNFASGSMPRVEKLDGLAQMTGSNELQINRLSNAFVVSGEFAVHEKMAYPTQLRSAIETTSWPSEKITNFENEEYLYYFSNNTAIYSDSEYIFAGSNHNWFHFVVEVLPLIVGLGQNSYIGKSIVLSQGHPTQVIELCRMLTGKDPLLIKHGDRAQFSDLLCISDNRFTKEFVAQHRIDDLHLTKGVLDSLFPESPNELMAKVAIRRPRNSFRVCRNIEQVFELLQSHGFQIIQPEELSLRDQFKVFRTAQVVVAESGAAITNAILMDAKSTLIELQPPGPETDFWRSYVALFGLNFRTVKGRASSIPLGEKLFGAGYMIPLGQLDEEVALFSQD